jgi:hypothetical protein
MIVRLSGSFVQPSEPMAACFVNAYGYFYGVLGRLCSSRRGVLSCKRHIEVQRYREGSAFT